MIFANLLPGPQSVEKLRSHNCWRGYASLQEERCRDALQRFAINVHVVRDLCSVVRERGKGPAGTWNQDGRGRSPQSITPQSTRRSLLALFFGLQPSSSRFLADPAGGLSRSREAINYVSFSCAPSSFDFPVAHIEEVMISSLWSVHA